jgi:hypothetical protein
MKAGEVAKFDTRVPLDIWTSRGGPSVSSSRAMAAIRSPAEDGRRSRSLP